MDFNYHGRGGGYHQRQGGNRGGRGGGGRGGRGGHHHHPSMYDPQYQQEQFSEQQQERYRQQNRNRFGDPLENATNSDIMKYNRRLDRQMNSGRGRGGRRSSSPYLENYIVDPKWKPTTDEELREIQNKQRMMMEAKFRREGKGPVKKRKMTMDISLLAAATESSSSTSGGSKKSSPLPVLNQSAKPPAIASGK